MATTQAATKGPPKMGAKAPAKAATAPAKGKAKTPAPAAETEKPAKTVGRGTSKDAPKRAVPEGFGKGRPSPYAGKSYSIVNKKYEGREGTWTAYMINTILAHKAVDDAVAAHKADTKSGFSEKSLDFRFAEDKGYIKLK